VFWVISVYFNIRNTLPKSGTFLLGHLVYIHLENDRIITVVVSTDCENLKFHAGDSHSLGVDGFTVSLNCFEQNFGDLIKRKSFTAPAIMSVPFPRQHSYSFGRTKFTGIRF